MFKVLILSLFLFCSNSFAQINNNNYTIFSSGPQTGSTVNSADQNNLAFLGGHFIINVSAYTSGNYTPHVQGKDPVSGVYYDILVGPSISATGVTIIKIFPGISPLPNASTNDILPQIWRVQLIGGSSPNMTISVSALLEQ